MAWQFYYKKKNKIFDMKIFIRVKNWLHKNIWIIYQVFIIENIFNYCNIRKNKTYINKYY